MMMNTNNEYDSGSRPTDDDTQRRVMEIIKSFNLGKREENTNNYDDNKVDSSIIDNWNGNNLMKVHKVKKNKKQKLREHLQLVEEQRMIPMEKNMYGVDKKLLILDINNVLISRSKFGCSDFNVRPHCKEFLLSMNDRFSLAIWTSMKKKTAKLFINIILGELPTITLKFIWYQPKCIIVKNNADHRINRDPLDLDDANNTTTSIWIDEKPVFLKDLSIVWKEYTYYNDSNTIIVDDSVEKCLNNYSYNCIHPKPFIALRNKVQMNYTSNKVYGPSSGDRHDDKPNYTHHHGDDNEIDIDEVDTSSTNRRIDYMLIDDDNELQLHGPLYLYLDSISQYRDCLKDYHEQHGTYRYA